MDFAFPTEMSTPYPTRRSPLLAANVVATSQPLAAQAGLTMLARGGSAVDAAIAAAITLAVVEPVSNGIGSDAFAILWDGQTLSGLNASGRAPRGWTLERFSGRDAMPLWGWDAVTVPGCVSAWQALWRRHGQLPWGTLFEPAIRYARDGFWVTPIIAEQWADGAATQGDQPGFAEAFLPRGRAPVAGEHFACPAMADTLTQIADSEGEAFYRGVLAEKMVAHSQSCGGAMALEDLAEHRCDWCDTVSLDFGEVRLHEIPPNGQGIAAPMALGLLAHTPIQGLDLDSVDGLHWQIEAMKLAFADVYAHVADPAAMAIKPQELLDEGYLKERAKLIDPKRAAAPATGIPKAGGTVYLAAADAAGRMVSFIQSNYMGFGSGVVVPGTGISLQNRGAAFSLDPGHPNVVGPGKRPFHTIIPAFVTRTDGSPLMAYGVMGGPMQPQGHLQVLLRILKGHNPQTACEAPRWRVMEGRAVAVEPTIPGDVIQGLVARGHDIAPPVTERRFGFGGAQVIYRLADGGFLAGSDPRKDGQAVGF
ncbi:MAG: gamma-glutamyltransferase family protein [Candidatus Competibacterales bacterium]